MGMGMDERPGCTAVNSVACLACANSPRKELATSPNGVQSPEADGMRGSKQLQQRSLSPSFPLSFSSIYEHAAAICLSSEGSDILAVELPHSAPRVSKGIAQPYFTVAQLNRLRSRTTPEWDSNEYYIVIWCLVNRNVVPAAPGFLGTIYSIRGLLQGLSRG
ncbi:hypothetical protein BX600DRAFT_492725 [Xylariales sp. PMI_506]|nr:hypothetical protein BX600DRAFT_492725 [Xylariales sp. PMI_506]